MGGIILMLLKENMLNLRQNYIRMNHFKWLTEMRN